MGKGGCGGGGGRSDGGGGVQEKQEAVRLSVKQTDTRAKGNERQAENKEANKLVRHV